MNGTTYFDEAGSGDLRDAVEERVLDWPGVTARTMFGCPSYLADGTVFAVVVTDGVALTRLPEERRDAVAEAFETGSFRAGDRTVTKWVQVTLDGPTDLDALWPHVEASYERARREADASGE